MLGTTSSGQIKVNAILLQRSRKTLPTKSTECFRSAGTLPAIFRSIPQGKRAGKVPALPNPLRDGSSE
jgi:hypothetical protein